MKERAFEIADVRLLPSDGGFRCEASIRRGGKAETLWYEVKGGSAPPPMEMAVAAMAAAALPAAVLRGEDLVLEQPCDSGFVACFPVLAQGCARMHEVKARIGLRATAASSAPRADRRVCVSFSGGVDSLYSLRKHKDRIGALATILGFEAPLREQSARDKIEARIAAFSEGTDLKHFFAATNFRDVFEKDAHLAQASHGAMMISLAFLLASEISEYIVPSSYSIDEVRKWGTHPLLDEAFKSNQVRIVHDGWEFHRLEKLCRLSDDPKVLRHMRVCANGSFAGNCGKCEKCFRTMTILMAIGKLDQASAFEKPLTLEGVRKFKLRTPRELVRYGQMLEFAVDCGHEELASAMRVLMRRGRVNVARRRLRSALKRLIGKR